MADYEGLEGLLGEERESADSSPPASGADAVALAIGLDAARFDPQLARKAGDYLDDQRELVRLQLRHFDLPNHRQTKTRNSGRPEH